MAVTTRTKVMIALGALGLLCMITGAILLGLADRIVHSRVSSQMPLNAKGKTFNQWKHPKGPLYFQVWVFNVVNGEGILQGEKPIVEEKGPYTYRDKRSKHDIKFSDDGTVAYKEKRHYEFERSMSVGPDSDTVTVTNLAMASVMTLLRDEDASIKTLVEALFFKPLNQTLFMEVPVHDLVWGYEDELLKALAPLSKQKNITLPHDNIIGIFTDKNDTESEEFVINSGQKGLSNFAEIISWGGEKQLSVWTSDYANTLNGSLGTLFPPFVKKEKQHYFFSTDLTRTLSLDFKKDVDARGIPLYKFVAPASNFANATINPNNKGFCTPAGHCLPSGLLNISNSHFGAPIVASNPHFLFCDEDIKESVQGLKSNNRDHESHVDIEPLTGLNMNFAIRIQINIHLQKISGFNETSNLNSLFLPTVWFDENAKISEHQANEFKNDVLNLVTTLHVIKYGFIAVGAVLLIIAASIPIVFKLREKSSSPEERTSIQNANRAKWQARHANNGGGSEIDPLLSTSMASESE